MQNQDRTRYRKTYSFYRQQPVPALQQLDDDSLPDDQKCPHDIDVARYRKTYKRDRMQPQRVNVTDR